MNFKHSPNGPVIQLRDSGFRGSLHTAASSQTGDVVFAWWASTPKERQAKATYSMIIPRLRLTNKMVRDKDGTLHQCVVPLPSMRTPIEGLRDFAHHRGASLLPLLPVGYRWHGPYLAIAHAPRLDQLGGYREVEPELSEETGLAHLVTGPARSAEALRIARAILSKRAVAESHAGVTKTNSPSSI